MKLFKLFFSIFISIFVFCLTSCNIGKNSERTVIIEYVCMDEKIEKYIFLEEGKETIEVYDQSVLKQMEDKIKDLGYSVTSLYRDKELTNKISLNQTINVNEIQEGKITVYCSIKPNNVYWGNIVKNTFNLFNYEQNFTFSRIVEGNETIWIAYENETKKATGDFFFDYIPNEEFYDENGEMFWIYDFTWDSITGEITYKCAIFEEFLSQGESCAKTVTSKGTVTWEDVQKWIEFYMEKETLNQKYLIFESKYWNSENDFTCYFSDTIFWNVIDLYDDSRKVTFIKTDVNNQDYSYKLTFELKED